jgi:hypothetical protein
VCHAFQRTEIERFFLSALEQVKAEARAKREQSLRTAKHQHSVYLKALAAGKPPSAAAAVAAAATTTTTTSASASASASAQNSQRLPAIAGSSSGLESPKPLPSALQGAGAGAGDGAVDVAELSLEEKDRVLRLLFAKLTSHPSAQAVAGATALPPHSFDIQLSGKAPGSKAQSEAGGAPLLLPPPPEISSERVPSALDAPIEPVHTLTHTHISLPLRFLA